MSCRRESSRPRCAPCFESTAFRQLNSLFPSSLRCGSRRSIFACFRSRASCTCLWTFAQRLGRQSTREQRELSRHKGSSLKSSLAAASNVAASSLCVPRIRLSGPGGLMFTPGAPDLAALLLPGISTDPLRSNRGIETFGRRPSPASTAWVCCT